MRQQINLFNPLFLKQKKHFSAHAMARASTLIVLGSFAVVAYAGYQVSRLRNEAELTAQQLEQAQNQFKKINNEQTKQKSKLLEDEIAKLGSDVKTLNKVLETLQTGELGNTQGYSDYLRAFSRQIVGGLWLTGFSIYGAGHEIGLQGRALQPALVPVYIGRLRQENVMHGKSFSTLEMQVPQTDNVTAPYIEFNIRSSGIPKAEPTVINAKPKPAAPPVIAAAPVPAPASRAASSLLSLPSLPSADELRNMLDQPSTPEKTTALRTQKQ
jgi:hypothetical protein